MRPRSSLVAQHNHCLTSIQFCSLLLWTNSLYPMKVGKMKFHNNFWAFNSAKFKYQSTNDLLGFFVILITPVIFPKGNQQLMPSWTTSPQCREGGARADKKNLPHRNVSSLLPNVKDHLATKPIRIQGQCIPARTSPPYFSVYPPYLLWCQEILPFTWCWFQ